MGSFSNVSPVEYSPNHVNQVSLNTAIVNTNEYPELEKPLYDLVFGSIVVPLLWLYYSRLLGYCNPFSLCLL